MFIIGSWTTTQ